MNSYLHIPPTGPYGVGYSLFDLHDENRPEIAYPKGRLIPVMAYFPTQKIKRILCKKPEDSRLPVFFPQTNPLGYANPASWEEIGLSQCPLVFMNHANQAYFTDYAILCEELASFGYVVFSIQHQLATDPHVPDFWSKRSCSKQSQIIDSLMYVFDWIQRSQQLALKNALNLNKLALLGHSMGGNALIMWANRLSSAFRPEPRTLFFRRDPTVDVQECMVLLDPDLDFSNNAKQPILFCLSEERKEHQVKQGTVSRLRANQYTFKHYPKTRHISFIDRALACEPFFMGTTEEIHDFFTSLRLDIRMFLQRHLI